VSHPAPVTASVTVPVSPEVAFAAFTEKFGQWWPAEYTWSQDVLEEIGIEPGEGGICFERGPHGMRCDWGRVLTWDPPARLRFTWQISPERVPVPDPSKASEVAVRFLAEGTGTRVELQHRCFERHGEAAADYARGMGSEQGWPLLLERFAVTVRAGD
jgi:uncharacterized protein YndB with AHSA1/START domain